MYQFVRHDARGARVMGSAFTVEIFEGNNQSADIGAVEVATPQQLSAVVLGLHNVQLAWTDDVNPSGTKYNVYRNGAPYTQTGEKKFQFGDLVAGMEYSFEVSAIFNGKESVRTSPVVVKMPNVVPGDVKVSIGVSTFPDVIAPGQQFSAQYRVKNVGTTTARLAWVRLIARNLENQSVREIHSTNDVSLEAGQDMGFTTAQGVYIIVAGHYELVAEYLESGVWKRFGVDGSGKNPVVKDVGVPPSLSDAAKLTALGITPASGVTTVIPFSARFALQAQRDVLYERIDVALSDANTG
jgi:hypothetical protein